MSGTPLRDTVSSVLGFYGKLPSHGDFVSRHLPGSFIDAWDDWLQQVLASGRAQLAEQWLDYYLSMPIWRFVIASGIFGENGWAGVLMPSVDRVGRYFPLTLAIALPEDSETTRFIFDQEPWYASLTRLALICLEEGFQFQQFEKGLIEPQLGVVRRAETLAYSSETPTLELVGIRLELGSERVDADLQEFARETLPRCGSRHSIWMTEGYEHVKSCIVACKGLPSRDNFVSFLDGRWDRSAWRDLSASA